MRHKNIALSNDMATHDVQPRRLQVHTMRRHLYKASKLVPFLNFVLQDLYK